MGEEIESIAESQVVVKRHIEEYLADLFGAQFAGENILFYLSYLLSKRPNDDSKDHPSLNSRKKLIKSFIEYGKNGRTSDVFLKSIIRALNGLNITACSFTETQLLEANFQFADTDQMYMVFGTSWSLVDREVKRNGIEKVGRVNYIQVFYLPYYQRKA